jgi:hypothetical protein
MCAFRPPWTPILRRYKFRSSEMYHTRCELILGPRFSNSQDSIWYMIDLIAEVASLYISMSIAVVMVSAFN